MCMITLEENIDSLMNDIRSSGLKYMVFIRWRIYGYDDVKEYSYPFVILIIGQKKLMSYKNKFYNFDSDGVSYSHSLSEFPSIYHLIPKNYIIDNEVNKSYSVTPIRTHGSTKDEMVIWASKYNIMECEGEIKIIENPFNFTILKDEYTEEKIIRTVMYV